MDVTPFKMDIDVLINGFSEGKFTTLDDMKRVWLARKFSFIYEASPTKNLTFFMQSLYAHSIGHMVSTTSLSHRLGGLYCLYCLYETQTFKPPFKIYLSLGELKKLKILVVDAKQESIKVVPALVKRMLERNMFLFGFVDINKVSVTERVNEMTNLQNAHVQVAYEKLFATTRIEHFLHMDLGMELDLKVLKKMSTEYAEAKELAIKGAAEVVDVQNIKHIVENRKLIGDAVEKITEDWNIQKEVFYQQTGFNHCPSEENEEEEHGNEDFVFCQQTEFNQSPNEEKEEEHESEDFEKELEQLLSFP